MHPKAQYDYLLVVDSGNIKDKESLYAYLYRRILRSRCLQLALYFQTWIPDTAGVLFNTEINQCSFLSSFSNFYSL